MPRFGLLLRRADASRPGRARHEAARVVFPSGFQAGAEVCRSIAKVFGEVVERQREQPEDLQELLDRISEPAENSSRISLGAVLDSVGRRSFGPILLLAGLVVAIPIVGDIPGVPTLMGLLVVITGLQLLFNRHHIWLPHWLLKRSVKQETLCKSVGMSRPVSRFMDRWTRPRLTRLTGRTGAYGIAVACITIAAATPAMELVPFSANGAGLALMAFGLALISRDGLLASIAFAVWALTIGAVAFVLF